MRVQIGNRSAKCGLLGSRNHTCGLRDLLFINAKGKFPLISLKCQIGWSSFLVFLSNFDGQHQPVQSCGLCVADSHMSFSEFVHVVRHRLLVHKEPGDLGAPFQKAKPWNSLGQHQQPTRAPTGKWSANASEKS